MVERTRELSEMSPSPPLVGRGWGGRRDEGECIEPTDGLTFEVLSWRDSRLVVTRWMKGGGMRRPVSLTVMTFASRSIPLERLNHRQTQPHEFPPMTDTEKKTINIYMTYLVRMEVKSGEKMKLIFVDRWMI